MVSNLPNGFFTLENIHTYRKLVNRVPLHGTIAELGSWKGKSICSIADIIQERKLKVIVVDTFNGTTGENQLTEEASNTNIQNQFKNNIKEFGIDHITILNTTTDKAVSYVEDNSIDLVFIDADHSYDAVNKDIKNWLPKIKNTGIISGHDYVHDHPGVVQAVNENFPHAKVENDIWQQNKISVTVEISTKDRYFTTLPLTLMSIIRQTFTPSELIIYDDGEHKDLRSVSVYQHLFTLLSDKYISWSVKFGNQIGQVDNHQRAISESQTEWIWRLDDDDYPEPDALEKLVSNITPNVGAVSGLILIPGNVNVKGTSSKIEDIYGKPNSQWSIETEKGEVDHFNNSFLFRKSAAKHGYPINLSPLGHREETIFTYGIKKAGWKLILDPSAVIWHLRDTSGGIRSHQNVEFYKHDEKVFEQFLKECGVKTSKYKHIVLDNGLGDHYAFKMALPNIRKAHTDDKLVIAACYPDVFKEEQDIELISIADAMALGIDIKKHCIYSWMSQNNWNGPLYKAFESLHT